MPIPTGSPKKAAAHQSPNRNSDLETSTFPFDRTIPEAIVTSNISEKDAKAGATEVNESRDPRIPKDNRRASGEGIPKLDGKDQPAGAYVLQEDQ